MPRENLPPDPDSLEKWQQLPQNRPSKNALPPMAGGLQWAFWLLLILAVVIIFGLLQGKMG